MATLVSDALTTVAEVETLLGLSSGADTDRITNAINHATKRILAYIDRKIASTAYTEYYDGTNTSILVLNNWPLIGNPTTVNVDNDRDFTSATDLTVDDDYLVENLPTAENPGVLRRLRPLGVTQQPIWPKGYQNIKVVYTAGYASTPTLLQSTCTEFAAFLYSKRGSRGNLRYSLGGVLVDEDVRDPSGIPVAFRGDLDAFRRPDMDDQFDNFEVPTLL